MKMDITEAEALAALEEQIGPLVASGVYPQSDGRIRFAATTKADEVLIGYVARGTTLVDGGVVQGVVVAVVRRLKG